MNTKLHVIIGAKESLKEHRDRLYSFYPYSDERGAWSLYEQVLFLPNDDHLLTSLEELSFMNRVTLLEPVDVSIYQLLQEKMSE